MYVCCCEDFVGQNTKVCYVFWHNLQVLTTFGNCPICTDFVPSTCSLSDNFCYPGRIILRLNIYLLSCKQFLEQRICRNITLLCHFACFLTPFKMKQFSNCHWYCNLFNCYQGKHIWLLGDVVKISAGAQHFTALHVHLEKNQDQPAHLYSLSRVYPVHLKMLWILGNPQSALGRLIRLHGCTGWSESLLGALVILQEMPWPGSFYDGTANSLDPSGTVWSWFRVGSGPVCDSLSKF